MKNKSLLIYPPFQLLDVETPRPDGSLGLLYLASALENAGIETDVLDASVGTENHDLKRTFYRNVKQENGLTRIGMDFEEISEYVSQGNYFFVGISSNFTPQTRMAIETAKAIKRHNTNVKIFAGGVNARSLKERFLESGFFDAVCLTEGERIFPEAILKKTEDVPGFAYWQNGNIRVNNVNSDCYFIDLDKLPMPAWNKLPLLNYGKIDSPHGVDVTKKETDKYAPIMTSRGCIFSCVYCHVSKEKGVGGLFGDIGKLRLHSIDRVLEEMLILKNLGIDKLFFEDDSLFSIKKRAKRIFDRAKRMGFSISNVNGVNLTNYFIKRGNYKYEIDDDFIETLVCAGFNQIVFPVESGSQRILNKYACNKINLEKMDLPLLMKRLSDVGIKAPVNIMIGFPDETENDIRESICLGKRLIDAGAPYVTFFITIPFPGSVLYDIAIKSRYLDKNFDTDLMNWKKPVMVNTTVPPERLEEIRDRATEEVNTQEHLRMRMQQSTGNRWISGK